MDEKIEGNKYKKIYFGCDEKRTSFDGNIKAGWNTSIEFNKNVYKQNSKVVSMIRN